MVLALCAGLSPVAQAAVDFNFSGAFSGTPPSSPGPWLTVSLSQAADNAVSLSIELPGSLPAGAYLDKLYLNYDPSANASLLSVSGPGIPSGAVAWGANNNAFKADGDGYYDVALDFPNPGSSSYGLGTASSASYMINGPTAGHITPDSFYPYYSAPGGGAGQYLIAAHVAGYSGASAWLYGTPSVPEPNSSLAGALLLLPLTAMGLLRRKGRSKETV